MQVRQHFALAPADPLSAYPRALRYSSLFACAAAACSLSAALLLPKGLLLAAVGDGLQVALVGLAAALSYRNFRRARAQIRDFWFLLFLGSAIWLVSLLLWSTYEIVLRRPVPDIPLADLLLVLKLVPLTAAVVLEPYRRQDSRFRAFGLLDVCILMVYALYLYAFCVYAYRLIPGTTDAYNFQFNLADAVGNQIFTLAAAVAVFRARGRWRVPLRIYFLSAACYCLASDISNVAIDLGRYYSGSPFDVPLVVALAGFVCFAWVGRTLQPAASPEDSPQAVSNELPASLTFWASHLAMLVTLSIPVLGWWLLSQGSSASPLFAFRLTTTLLTIFLLTLLLSLKEDLLTVKLIGSLRKLSENYSSINRLQDHLVQSEKLTSLGELVAHVAGQIKGAMASILELSARIPSAAAVEPRVPSLSGKIAHYARRTDALVQNMLRFAQETPLQMAPTEIKPLLESAIHLSRISKIPNIRVDFQQHGSCPLVRADSSQLLHVFLQLLSNSVDALEESGGGSLEISIRSSASHVHILFADSGPGMKEPGRVFEPFYTTKPVGKGTGLGLSTCYGIIHQHEGEISCANRPAGGALFSILLPAVQEIPGSPPAPFLVAEDAR